MADPEFISVHLTPSLICPPSLRQQLTYKNIQKKDETQRTTEEPSFQVKYYVWPFSDFSFFFEWPRFQMNILCKIQKNWCTVAVAPTIEHHGGHSWTPANQRWDQVPGGVICIEHQLRALSWLFEPLLERILWMVHMGIGVLIYLSVWVLINFLVGCDRLLNRIFLRLVWFDLKHLFWFTVNRFLFASNLCPQ